MRGNMPRSEGKLDGTAGLVTALFVTPRRLIGYTKPGHQNDIIALLIGESFANVSIKHMITSIILEIADPQNILNY
jgi:hypothetical protein